MNPIIPGWKAPPANNNNDVLQDNSNHSISVVSRPGIYKIIIAVNNLIIVIIDIKQI